MTEVDRVRAAVAAAVSDTGSTLSPILRACRACAEFITVGDGVAFSVIKDRQHRETLYVSGEDAETLEELQFTLGEGPSFEAFESGGPVLVPDLHTATASAWPAFAHAAQAHPFAGIFVLPLQWGAVRLGVMDIYRRLPGPLGVDELESVLQVADVAVWALLTLQDADGEEGALNWTDGTASHRHVHQATGMLMARLGVPAEDALALLRSHAFLTDQLIGQVAGDVVQHGLRPGTVEP